jgi:chromosome segregation ATPase
MESILSSLWSDYEELKDMLSRECQLNRKNSEEHQKEIEKLKTENDDLKGRVNCWKEAFFERNAIIENLGRKISEKVEELGSCQARVETLEQMNFENFNEIENLKENLAVQVSVSDEFSEKLVYMEVQKEALSLQKSRWLLEMRQLEQDNDLLKKCFQTIRTHLRRQDGDLRRELQSNGIVDVDCNLLVVEFRELVTELEKLRKEMSELQTQNFDLKNHYSEKLKDLRKGIQVQRSDEIKKGSNNTNEG